MIKKYNCSLLSTMNNYFNQFSDQTMIVIYNCKNGHV